MTRYERSDWGAPPFRGDTPAGPGTSLVVHHTGGGAPPATVDDAKAMLAGIRIAHLNQGYADIAYNMAVDNLGNLYEARGMQWIGGATYGANGTTRAVVWLGNSDVEPPSPAALAAIRQLWIDERGVNLTEDATITGHRDWTATACPGDTLYGMLPAITEPSTEEEDMLFVTWTVPDGRRYIVDRRTGHAPEAGVVVPSGADIEATIAELVRTGACRDLGAVTWEANWVLRTAQAWTA